MINPRFWMNVQEVVNSLNALSKIRDLELRAIKSVINCLAEMINPRLGMKDQSVDNSFILYPKFKCSSIRIV